jgi:glycosyltransferase involved in cell wall biosynthesis
MSCGVPCVSSDVGDARTIIGGTGEVVPVGDAGAAAAAIRRLLAEPPEAAERRRREARERIEKDFPIGRMAAMYGELYERLARDRESST